MREYLDELLEHWDDAYWRADHPEVMAVLIALISGVIGLTFALIEIRVRQQALTPTPRGMT